MTDRLYILDTSALRSETAEYVCSLSKRAKIAVSPITVFELSSHLGEPDAAADEPGTAYRRARGQILKCRYVDLLDDPYAEAMERIELPEIAHHTRFEERELVGRMLDEIVGSDTLDELNERCIRDPSGASHSCKDLGLRMETLRSNSHRRYEGSVKVRSELLCSSFGARLEEVSGDPFVRVASAGCEVLAEHIERTTATAPQFRNALFAAMYLRLGYETARAIRYAKHSSGKTPIRIDGNDVEDGLICQHLDLTLKRTLVTGDNGTLRAVGAALDALISALSQNGARARPRAEVIDQAELRSRFPVR
jgi:hypothetical protein